MIQPVSHLSPAEWQAFVDDYPQAHLLQSREWGELKSSFGWEALRLKVERQEKRIGAQILFRRLPIGLSLAYLPRGPIGDAGMHQDEVLWAEIDRLCRKRRSVFLKFEPDSVLDDQQADQNYPPQGFKASPQAIQPTRTIVIDLRDDEETILGRMKQKTRYNIRLAGKKGVKVRPSANIDTFYQLMQVTGERDEFGIHNLQYYHQAYELFHPGGKCELFMAEYADTTLAAVLVFVQGTRSWYLYGASSSLHREKMPAYLLQWEAMKWAKQKGCSHYDLWGIPDYDQEILETQFMDRSDGLWGVYRFKRGFGGKVYRSSGPWDRVYHPFLYNLYLRWVERNGIEP
jgi:lipid II:glycine glycyltransferase (peptidoglycan interpeptide bridge formation enzyme)